MKLTNNFVKGKRVFLRADFNVPLKNGEVLDDTKLRAALPTIKLILGSCNKLIIASHLGRPKDTVDKRYSLEPVQKKLRLLLKKDVGFASNYSTIPDNKIVLLENLRFYKGEKANDKLFAKKLASMADVYVNDAFGTAHRKHASVYELAKLLPAVPGLLMHKEIDALSMKKTKKPIFSILGFAKISDKVQIIEGLLEKTDFAIIGGAAVFTFLKAQGYDVGKSLYEPSQVPLAKKILRRHGTHLLLAVDFITLKGDVVPFTSIGKNDVCLDIGPASVELFKGALAKANTVIWNGPLGMFEKGFDKSREIAQFLVKKKIKTIIGGGDTAAMINKYSLAKSVYHVSTGGGAALEMLAGKEMPGIDVLK